MTSPDHVPKRRTPWSLSPGRYLERLRGRLVPWHATAGRSVPDLAEVTGHAGIPGQNEWDEARLAGIIAGELTGTDVIIVSNREPYVHSTTGEGIRYDVPAGGLVSALEPLARSSRGTWIAHGSGSADRETVDDADRLRVPPDDPRYTLRRVWLSREEEQGYYLGFANESLWPLCHNAFVRPVFRAGDWQHYVNVNERFAEAVAEEARSKAPVVIVQDYHFALLPRMIRQRLPEATILTFWHIPWPNAEVFGICPHAADILGGLLASDIVGFQIPLFRMNFAECVERTLESRINREDWSIRHGGRVARVRDYPISIPWPERGAADPEQRRKDREDMGVPEGGKLILGVGRLDYTKGIPESLTAFGQFLQNHPERAGRAHFFCVAAPSRSEINAYRNLRETCRAISDEINARHGADGYRPLTFADRHFDREALGRCYRAADICIVPSLHDGMNLVAKEFVANRDEEDGALILSRFAGAIHELPEALKVNPFDIAQMAETMNVAFGMPLAEQRERMRRMRDTVYNRNIYRWAGRLLTEAAHFSQRSRLMSFRQIAPVIGAAVPQGPHGELARLDRSNADPADS